MDQPHRHTAHCFEVTADCFSLDGRSDERLRESCQRREDACRALGNRYGIPWERIEAPADPEEMAFLDAVRILSPRIPQPEFTRYRLGLQGEGLARYEARLIAFVPILTNVLELHREKQTSMTI